MPAVKEDWHAKMQARFNAESIPTMEVFTGEDGEQEILLEPYFDEKGLHFGPYSADPVQGLHFNAPRDTAASQ